jgi:hypothetical protein
LFGPLEEGFFERDEGGFLLGSLEGGLLEREEVGFLCFSGGGGEESVMSMISGSWDVEAIGSMAWGDGVSTATTKVNKTRRNTMDATYSVHHRQ